jgi:hypothetical protein
MADAGAQTTPAMDLGGGRNGGGGEEAAQIRALLAVGVCIGTSVVQRFNLLFASVFSRRLRCSAWSSSTSPPTVEFLKKPFLRMCIVLYTLLNDDRVCNFF